jgi:hypothetical protein
MDLPLLDNFHPVTSLSGGLEAKAVEECIKAVIRRAGLDESNVAAHQGNSRIIAIRVVESPDSDSVARLKDFLQKAPVPMEILAVLPVPRWVYISPILVPLLMFTRN